MRKRLQLGWLFSLLCLTASVPASAQKKITAKNIKNKTAEAKALAAAVETAAVAPKQKEDAPPKRPPAPPVPPNVTQPTPLPSLTTGPLSHLLGKRNEGVK